MIKPIYTDISDLLLHSLLSAERCRLVCVLVFEILFCSWYRLLVLGVIVLMSCTSYVLYTTAKKVSLSNSLLLYTR